MAIDWQTRGEGPHAHRYHRLTDEQAKALAVPAEPGVYGVDLDGETVFAVVLPALVLPGRPLRFLPVVYATREDAEAHADCWAARDRDVFWSEVAAGLRSA